MNANNIANVIRRMTCADRNHTLRIYATDIIYIRVDLHGTFFVLELIYMDIEIQH